MDIDNYNYSNLYDTIMQNMIIENNIFGYEKIDKIKIIFYPEEIVFLKENDIPILNGDFINENYQLYQDLNMTKSNNYYKIEYQYMVKEAEYSIFHSLPIKKEGFNLSGSILEDQSDYYTQNTFYGRVITLKFKLCYELCETCSSLGITVENQSCITCIEEYVNDFLNPSNCIKTGYYKDGDNLIECTDENSKFYINEYNKSVCFNTNLECPEAYSDYNPITKECKASNKNCSYNLLINNSCSYSKYNNSEIYNKIIKEIIPTYPANGSSVIIEGKDNYIFQITTVKNEINEINSFNGSYANKYNLSIIDIDDLEKKIKESNTNINISSPLIILKYEKVNTSASDKNFQFEVYDYNTKKKLNLSLYEQNTKIDVYIPEILDEKTNDLYIDLNNSGYDLFDINNSFYQDICTPYKSENGTDVLLSDRIKDYYINRDLCQNNCKYSNYLFENDILKCE